MRNTWLLILFISLFTNCKKGDTIINVNIDNSNENEQQDPLIGKWTLTEVAGEDVRINYMSLTEGDTPLPISAGGKVNLQGRDITATIEFREENFVYVKEGNYFFDLLFEFPDTTFQSEIEVNFLSPQAHWEQIKDELILTRIGGSDAISTILMQNKEILMLNMPLFAHKQEGERANIGVMGDVIYTFEKIK